MSESAEIGVSVPIEPTASWPVVGHRRQEELQVFLGVAEGLLAIEQRHVRGLGREAGTARQVLEHDLGAASHVL